MKGKPTLIPAPLYLLGKKSSLFYIVYCKQVQAALQIAIIVIVPNFTEDNAFLLNGNQYAWDKIHCTSVLFGKLC